jgi:GT2 family glycosyltransferase
MGTPAISISILNFQRRDTLRRGLGCALSQDHPNFEVLVVDNASTDGSAEMAETEFPSARVVRMAANVGCAARNAGVAAARGPIVVTIDNDVLLDDSTSLRRVEEQFARQPGVVCANFRILDADGRLSRRDWCHPRDFAEAERPFLTDYVLEGACAFRRAAFLDAGGYWEPFFIGHEGVDLALRLLDAGGDLLYWPDVSVRHLVSAEARPSPRIYYAFTRNSFWIPVRNHRLAAGIVALSRDMALMSFSSLRAGQVRPFLRGAVDGLRGCGRALQTRRPLRTATYQRLRELRRHAPSTLAKARRHFAERPI